ncbi:MAG: Cna B-type domain-containing protein [Lachnospiraceae bacterium]|nr:Cna B-type domain-containing protein [Lachnospiraceae bacterium]
MKKIIRAGTVGAIAMALTCFTSSMAYADNKDLYNHIDVKIETVFDFGEYEDSKLNKETVIGKVNDITVKLDDKTVDMNKAYDDESADKGIFEYHSVLGHDGNDSIGFGENSIIEVSGTFSYKFGNKTSKVAFSESFDTAKSTNPCKGEGSEYGYDAIITSKDIQRIINNTFINIVKHWDDEENSGKRPDSVKFDIYQDGDVFKTVELTSDNGWVFSISSLPNGDYNNGIWETHKYTIKEKKTDKYSASEIKYNPELMAYEVTNLFIGDNIVTPEKNNIVVIEDNPIPNSDNSKEDKKTDSKTYKVSKDTKNKADNNKTAKKNNDDNSDTKQPDTADLTPVWLLMFIGLSAAAGMVIIKRKNI